MFPTIAETFVLIITWQLGVNKRYLPYLTQVSFPHLYIFYSPVVESLYFYCKLLSYQAPNKTLKRKTYSMSMAVKPNQFFRQDVYIFHVGRPNHTAVCFPALSTSSISWNGHKAVSLSTLPLFCAIHLTKASEVDESIAMLILSQVHCLTQQFHSMICLFQQVDYYLWLNHHHYSYLLFHGLNHFTRCKGSQHFL